ncbi:ABC transporter ATP-binding protein [Glaciihabitans arcticus]|uniref:ABC transporter ATP-binding protein n=1 Tax=Glaciihabitans arcticus TaxID=2668039 RepID=A0A4Q9GQ64_9MICO|nr:ABC transporter ATP-binding protein [Glaciihabitans arcticus]TBN56831.1 ABC transporter ATP-binding protein [Glaciihabitans arcticus]
MTESHSLTATGLSLSYDGVDVITGLDVAIPPGSITVIVGANACGKSTLLRGLARLMRPGAGGVELDGRDIHSYGAKELARLVGLLPQQPIAPAGITVADLVARGRYPHQGWFARGTARDDAAVAHALEQTSTADLAERAVEELSGGQRQRVWIAMVLAQEPEILLLDEPTTFLDVAHQVEVLDLLMHLNRERGTTVVMVLHDLNLAARYADHLIVMAGGAIVDSGAPAEVITRETVRTAFGMDSVVMPDPVSGSPMVVPLGRFHSLG